MKTILMILVAVPASTSGFGQGLVMFANQTTTRISTNGMLIGGPVGTWYFALFRAPSTQNTIDSSTDPTLHGWTSVALGTNTGTPGRLSGNTSSEGVIVSPTAPTTYDYAVAGWSADIGATWADAETWWNNGHPNSQGIFGISTNIANDVITNPSGSPINSVFGTVPDLIPGFTLLVFVPEPSAVAIAGAGAAVWFLSRRRRRS